MDALMPLIVQLISGAVGGNVAGAAMKDKSLGMIGNSIAGIVGGGLGGQLLEILGIAVAAGGTDVNSMAGSAGSGGVGGAVLLIIVAAVKKMLNK
jgi:uncharacterized membrane protein YeaQ/YmgE (transglycosylase-associated protein family)